MRNAVLESELAWYLADECRDRFTPEDRTQVFVLIGAEDFREAIVYVLDACARQRILLPDEAGAKLAEWLRVYDLDHRHQSAVARVTG
jgi:hypothetical protein